MLHPITNRAVNWTKGMKMSKDYFVQTEDYLCDLLRDGLSLQLSDFNFGLLPPYAGQSKSADFEINERVTNHVEVILRRCNAITAGGCRINFNPADHKDYLTLEYAFDQDESENIHRWDIMLVEVPFSRIPEGEPDPNETPPRHPDVVRKYELRIIPAGRRDALNLGYNSLIIGRVSKQDDRYVVDEDFIPPSTSISSHPMLVRYYERFGKLLNDIELSAHKILQKVQERERPSDVAKNVSFVCQNLIEYISIIYFDYRNKARRLPPVDTVSYFSSLAHVCFSSLNFIKKWEREELLKYFYEWSDVTPGNFSEMLSSMLETVYDHGNIRAVMQQTDHFLTVFSELLTKLSTLEYIGQHKENIVVAEKTQRQEVTAKKGWTLLD